MKKCLHIFDKLPSFSLSIVIGIIILVLTLMPNPPGSEMKMFLGVDKLVHFIMFGGMSLAIGLDVQRRNWNERFGLYKLFITFLSASIMGVMVEVMQSIMEFDRSFEYLDIVADSLGALTFSVVLSLLLKKYNGN